MSEKNMMMALAKVMIAAAWADGEVTKSEINHLKRVMGRLPEISAREWTLLDMYIDAPVDAAERARLVEELRQVMTGEANKALAITALQDMVTADSTVTEDETRVQNEIIAAIESAQEGTLGGMMRLVKGLVKPPPPANFDGPNREEFFEDFVKNRVYYKVQQRFNLNNEAIDIPDTKLRKLSLAGGLMARVARVDHDIVGAEIDTISQALQNGWGLSLPEATLVAEVAVSDEAAAMNKFHLSNEFLKLCTIDELTNFLDVLFVVATADGDASYEEIEEIRTMANAFNLPNKYFGQAKVKAKRKQQQE